MPDLDNKSYPTTTTQDSQPPRTMGQTELFKRIRNRHYKRASRLRHGAPSVARAKDPRGQYHVSRWRLDEQIEISVTRHSSLAPGKPDPGPSKTTEAFPGEVGKLGNLQNIVEESFTMELFPLSADHLIHLVKHNVFRGLLRNKSLVDSLTVQYDVPGPQLEIDPDHVPFPRYSAILPTRSDYSGSLMPTLVQMNVNHFSWIDCLPCPTLRENLIRHGSNFSHADFINDLVGSLINLKLFLPSSAFSRAPVPGEISRMDGTGPPAGTGLIIWGEPYLISSWEMTPGFLHKWNWALENCQELINSTNYWRLSRGDAPLLPTLGTTMK